MMNKIKKLLDNGFFIEINPGDRGYWVKLEKPLPYEKIDGFQTPETPYLNQAIDWAYNLVIKDPQPVSTISSKLEKCAALTKAMNSLRFNTGLSSIEVQSIELVLRGLITEIENDSE